MKVLWQLSANIKGINMNKSYEEYDDRNLNSKYWMYDIISFIKDNNGIIHNKQIIYTNQYEIIFSCASYDFVLNDYVKFKSGRFYTSLIKINYKSSNEQTIFLQQIKNI